MILSPLAKHANTPENYKKLYRLIDAHDKAGGQSMEQNISIDFDPDDLENVIKAVMDKTMKKFIK